jgi:flagellar motor component MotA
VQANNLWVSLNHHGRFSSADQSQTLNEINTAIGEGSAFLKEASLLIVTFGTSIGYYHGNEGHVAANCHKIDAKFFTKKRTDISEIVGVWTTVLSELITQNPSLKVLFTVSPVRHLREGFEENQKSKAALLLAIEQLQQAFPDSCLYFPSYEIMMDDLRDYRFYEADMIHPNAQAIQYIREKFFGAVMSKETLENCNLMESQIRKIEHRGIHENAEQKERRIADANEAIRRILLKS